MRRLLCSSLAVVVLAACGTSEDSVDTTGDAAMDATTISSDSVTIVADTVRGIIHGSPEQEKLDSIKNAKKKEKQKK